MEAMNRERSKLQSRQKALCGEPQEHFKHETRLEGSVNMEPIEGKQTLKGVRDWCGSTYPRKFTGTQVLKGRKSYERGLKRTYHVRMTCCYWDS